MLEAIMESILTDPDLAYLVERARVMKNWTACHQGFRTLVETEDEIIRKEIKASVYARCRGDFSIIPLPHEKTFTVVDFGVYQYSPFLTLPAEFTVLEFSVVDGIKKCFTRILDPGKVPLGYRSDAREGMATNGYLAPCFEFGFDWLRNCLHHILVSMYRHNSRNAEPGFIYVMPSKMEIVKESLLWISEKLKKAFDFKLMPLTGLVHVLLAEAVSLRHLNNADKMSCVSETAVLELLNDAEFDVESSLACNFHQLESRSHLSQHCTQTYVKCRVYNALKLLCLFYDVPRYMLNHFPRIDRACLVNNLPYQMDAYSSDSCCGGDASFAALSVASTNTLLFHASNVSSSDCGFSSSCDDSEVEEVPTEIEEELRRTLATFEVFPTNKNLTAEPKRGFEIRLVPSLKERSFPANPIPFTHAGGIAPPPYCKRCLEYFCRCGSPQYLMSLQARQSEDGYVRYGNPASGHKIWPVIQEVNETQLKEDTIELNTIVIDI